MEKIFISFGRQLITSFSTNKNNGKYNASKIYKYVICYILKTYI